MLDDNRHIRLEHRRKISVARNRRRSREIVETQMQRATRRHCNPVGADRIAIGKEDGKRDKRVAVAGIQDASSLVGNEVAIREGTLRRNVPFGNRPALAADGVHGHMPLSFLRRGGRRTLERQVKGYYSIFKRGMKGVYQHL